MEPSPRPRYWLSRAVLPDEGGFCLTDVKVPQFLPSALGRWSSLGGFLRVEVSARFRRPPRGGYRPGRLPRGFRATVAWTVGYAADVGFWLHLAFGKNRGLLDVDRRSAVPKLLLLRKDRIDE